MIFAETELPGAFRIDLARLDDERGFFARSFCQQEFIEHGLDPCVAQCNVSFNHFKGTLRGMHFQLPPHAEAKLVRCTCGALYDVIVDLRPTSRTYLHWAATELTAGNRTGLYIPKGFAHGFQTLVDNTEIFYQMSEFYAPGSSGGVRWDDPVFEISWPIPVNMISPRDANYENYHPGTPFFKV